MNADTIDYDEVIRKLCIDQNHLGSMSSNRKQMYNQNLRSWLDSLLDKGYPLDFAVETIKTEMNQEWGLPSPLWAPPSI